MIFTASRLSEGNKLFPAEIHIEPNGLTVKIPGFFSRQIRHLDYQHIGEVSIKTPLVGYSTITFFTAGTMVTAHGFTSSDVKSIKQAIDDGKRQRPTSVLSSITNNDNPTVANASGGDNVTVINKGDGFLTSGVKGMFGILEKDYEAMSNNNKKGALKLEEVIQMTFNTDANEISNQLNQLVSLASSTQNKPLKSAIVEKLEFGIIKLRGLNASGEADFFEKKLEPLKKKSWF